MLKNERVDAALLRDQRNGYLHQPVLDRVEMVDRLEAEHAARLVFWPSRCGRWPGTIWRFTMRRIEAGETTVEIMNLPR
jgi:hypothetical protein